jgi:NAD(P)-dependent dehydrogenase (short-subunit alcohol dehydrogenase family)
MASTNKYAETHLNPKGVGDARPTGLQIIKDEGLEGNLDDKIVLITGTSSGIGVSTATALAATGATIYCAARDEKKNRKALGGVQGNIELLKLDLSSMESVRAAADEFLKRSAGKLNILINNAGVMAVKTRTLTADGHEMQFGTNHMGHFLLFQLLKPALLASSTPEFPSRVVNLTSAGHRFSGVRLNNLSLNGEYRPFIAYGQSKTANIYMANSIERHYGCQGLHGLSVHPGNIWTELARHLDQMLINMLTSGPNVKNLFKSQEQGAATTVLAAVGKQYHGKGALYLEDCGEWGQARGGARVEERGFAPFAFDPDNEEKLWKESLRLVGMSE